MSDTIWDPTGIPQQGGEPVALASVRHKYPLVVRDAGLATGISLMLQSMPYALARFGVELAFTTACVIWMVVTFGGAAWLGDHIAGVFGIVWFIFCIFGAGWFWFTLLRYVMHVITCGHVAVLTELITKGAVGNGSESMFAYGRRIVTEKFKEVNVLFGMNALVRGVLNSFHATLDWVAGEIPIPGMDSIANLVTMVLRAATRYLDKVIFSYTLARNDDDPWRDAQEGIVYYVQNAKPILKSSIWIVIQERVLTILMWLVLLIPAALITKMLPHSVRESGAIVVIVIAILLAAAVRAAFVKPVFLIMTMVRYHALIENQPINEAWAGQLAGMSQGFSNFGPAAALAAKRF